MRSRVTPKGAVVLGPPGRINLFGNRIVNLRYSATPIERFPLADDSPQHDDTCTNVLTPQMDIPL